MVIESPLKLLKESGPKRIEVNISHTDLADLELAGVRVPYLDDLFKEFEQKEFGKFVFEVLFITFVKYYS